MRRFPFDQKFRKFRVGERMEETFSGISFRNFGSTSRGWPKIPENRNNRKILFHSSSIRPFLLGPRFSETGNRNSTWLILKLLRTWLHGEFQPGLKFRSAHRAEILLRLHAQFQPGRKTQISVRKFTEVRKHSRYACSRSFFSPGWKNDSDYRLSRLHGFSARLAGLKILARFENTGLGFSARAELRPRLNCAPSWIPLHVIDNLVFRGFVSKAGLKWSALDAIHQNHLGRERLRSILEWINSRIINFSLSRPTKVVLVDGKVSIHQNQLVLPCI